MVQGNTPLMARTTPTAEAGHAKPADTGHGAGEHSTHGTDTPTAEAGHAKPADTGHGAGELLLNARSRIHQLLRRGTRNRRIPVMVQGNTPHMARTHQLLRRGTRNRRIPVMVQRNISHMARTHHLLRRGTLKLRNTLTGLMTRREPRGRLIGAHIRPERSPSRAFANRPSISYPSQPSLHPA